MTCCSKSLDGTNSQIRRRPCAASSIMRQPTAIGRQSSEKCAAGAAAKAALSGIGADRLSLAPILLLLKRKDRAIAAGPVGRQEARAGRDVPSAPACRARPAPYTATAADYR